MSGTFNSTTHGLNSVLTETIDIFIPILRTTYYGLNAINILGAKLWTTFHMIYEKWDLVWFSIKP